MYSKINPVVDKQQGSEAVLKYTVAIFLRGKGCKQRRKISKNQGRFKIVVKRASINAILKVRILLEI